MPNINPKIFKSYDVRGVYPDELNEEVTEKIGRAFVSLTGAKTVVVARDMRLGGEELTRALTRALVENGVRVIDIGLVPIDGMYFGVCKYGFDGGMMVTASHNPKEYNGFKMVTRDAKGINVIRGIDLKEKVLTRETSLGRGGGSSGQKDIWPDYLEHVFSFVDKSKIKPLKVVIDAGNGLAGRVIPMLGEKLPAEIIRMNFEVDGTFPAHPSNPLLPESQVSIQKRVLAEGADIGFIFDGDTDRIFLVDDKGNFLRGDTTLIFLAKYFLDNKLGEVFIYNVICSRAVPELVEKMGGRALRERVGYVNISSRMKKEGGVLGGEVSGHYSFAKNFYADSGFITFLMILQVLSESNESLSEMVKDFNPYFRGDEISFEVEDIPGKLDLVRQTYKDYKQDELDGVTIDAWEAEGWWLNVRPSNTEPLLRITVEGRSEDLLKKKQEEFLRIIDF